MPKEVMYTIRVGDLVVSGSAGCRDAISGEFLKILTSSSFYEQDPFRDLTCRCSACVATRINMYPAVKQAVNTTMRSIELHVELHTHCDQVVSTELLATLLAEVSTRFGFKDINFTVVQSKDEFTGAAMLGLVFEGPSLHVYWAWWWFHLVLRLYALNPSHNCTSVAELFESTNYSVPGAYYSAITCSNTMAAWKDSKIPTDEVLCVCLMKQWGPVSLAANMKDYANVFTVF